MIVDIRVEVEDSAHKWREICLDIASPRTEARKDGALEQLNDED